MQQFMNAVAAANGGEITIDNILDAYAGVNEHGTMTLVDIEALEYFGRLIQGAIVDAKLERGTR
jgi:hypothetical protein